MSPLPQPRRSFPVLLAALVLAGGFLLWSTQRRIERVEFVTASGTHLEMRGQPLASSPTGYPDGRRELIIPEHNDESYQWIAQTQQMLADGGWRLRQVDSDNAPEGRETRLPALYRWWYGLLSWLDHVVTGLSQGLSVERAALYVEPLLHAMLLVVTAVCVWRWSGAWPAAAMSLGIVTVYPFATGFLPAVPDHHGLAAACVLWSLLPLLSLREPRSGPAVANALADERAVKKRFALAGVAGGLGLWVSVAQQWPILGAIVIGATMMAWLGRRTDSSKTAVVLPPWRRWAQAGAATTLGAWLLDSFPGDLWPWRWETANPVFALAWLGAGELLARGLPAVHGTRLKPGPRGLAIMILSAAAVAAPFVLAWRNTGAFLPVDPLGSRLTNLPEGVVAESLRAWVKRDGWTGALLATLLPAVVGVPWMATRVFSRKRTAAGDALILALVASAVVLPIACAQLQRWHLFGAVMLAAVPMITRLVLAQGGQVPRGVAAALFAIVSIAGAVQAFPKSIRADKTLTASELHGLIERELGYWLGKRAGPGKGILLAPPARTTSLAYYGGIRGLGTLAWENRAGRAAAVRIASAGRPDEALALVERRGVTHIVIPSWDLSLDDYARLGSPRPEDSFIAALQQWSIPPWLRPIPYSLPAIPGFEQQYVLVFEYGADDGESIALSRLVEYFLETDRAQLAEAAATVLQRYPADFSGLVALAQMSIVKKDRDGLMRTIDRMNPALANGQEKYLPFDRQVNLGVILGQARKTERARAIIEHCLRAATAADLRGLSPELLYRLHVTAKALNVAWPDRGLEAYARDLVSPQYRPRLP